MSFLRGVAAKLGGNGLLAGALPFCASEFFAGEMAMHLDSFFVHRRIALPVVVGAEHELELLTDPVVAVAAPRLDQGVVVALR